MTVVLPFPLITSEDSTGSDAWFWGPLCLVEEDPAVAMPSIESLADNVSLPPTQRTGMIEGGLGSGYFGHAGTLPHDPEVAH